MANLQADITIGQRGPTGPAGPAGPQGPAGPRGPQGVNGDGTTTQLIVQTSEDTVELNPNVYYNLVLNNATDTTAYLVEGTAGLANEYLGQITVANDGFMFSIPNVQWIIDGEIEYTEDTEYTIIMDTGNTYLFSVVNNIGVMVVL